MALTRDLPYLANHFRVQWKVGDEPVRECGFCEVVLPAFAADAGKADAPQASGAAQLILRRGFTGALELYHWWDGMRRRADTRGRTLWVELLDGESGAVVCTWEFAGVRPAQLAYSPLQGLPAAVLVETLTLDYDAMTMK